MGFLVKQIDRIIAKIYESNEQAPTGVVSGFARPYYWFLTVEF